MQAFNLLRVFFVVCLSFLGMAELGWTSSALEDVPSSISYEVCKKEVSFDVSGPVYVECSYPIFSGKGALIEQVNRRLKTEAEAHFDCFVQGEIFTEETWEDGVTLSYELLPVCQQPNLISIYGCDFQGRGCHGCTYYEGKTFWQKGNSVIQLVLDDLFVKGSGFQQCLLEYCEDYFKTSGYGYYSSRSELLPELGLNDLDIFVPTDKGLMIVFSAYRVGGWADGPDKVLIPYANLREFIDPFGPLREILE